MASTDKGTAANKLGTTAGSRKLNVSPIKSSSKIRLKPISSLSRKKQYRSATVPSIIALNKTDDKYYIGPSDRIGRNYSPAVEGLQKRGAKTSFVPPSLPHLDSVVHPRIPRKPPKNVAPSVREWTQPNNISFVTKSKSNAGYSAFILSEEHRKNVRASRFKFKTLDPAVAETLGADGTKSVHIDLPAREWRKEESIKNFLLPKGSPRTYRSRKGGSGGIASLRYGNDMVQMELGKLKEFIERIGTDAYFDDPQHPIGGHEWTANVFDRMGMHLRSEELGFINNVLFEINCDFKKAMARASIKYQILNSDEEGHFGISADVVRPIAMRDQNSVDVPTRGAKVLSIQQDSATKEQTTKIFECLVGQMWLKYDPLMLWMREMWSDENGMVIDKESKKTVSFQSARLTIVDDANFNSLLPIHPLVYKENEGKRRMRIRYEMWQSWRKKIAYAIQNRVVKMVADVNTVREEIQSEIDGRGIQPCDSDADFGKFYKTLTKSETTYVAPTLHPVTIKNWYPEIDDLALRPIKPSRWARWIIEGNKVSIWPIKRIAMIVENAAALQMVQVQEQTAASLEGFADFFERYTTAAGIPDGWHEKQRDREHQYTAVNDYFRAKRHKHYPQLVVAKGHVGNQGDQEGSGGKDDQLTDASAPTEGISEKEDIESFDDDDGADDEMEGQVCKFFQPYCTGYEMPIFIPAFTCEITVVSVLDASYRLYAADGQHLPFSLHPPFSQLEKLLQEVVTGIVDCSQMYPSVQFSEEDEIVTCGIPDAQMEAARLEKKKILREQQLAAAIQAMEEAQERGEEVDPDDYLIEEESDDDNEDEEEEVAKLNAPVVPGIFVNNSIVAEIREKITRVFKLTEPAVNKLLMSFEGYAPLFAPGVDAKIKRMAEGVCFAKLPEFYRTIDSYMEMHTNIWNHCDHTEYLPRGLVEIKTFKFVRVLAARALELGRVLLEAVKQQALSLCEELSVKYQQLVDRLHEEMGSSDEIYEMRLSIENITKVQIPHLKDSFNGDEGLIKFVELLIEFAYKFEEEDRLVFRKAYMWPQELQTELGKANAKVLKESEKYLGFLKVQREQMDGDVKAISSGLKSLQTRGGLSQQAIIEMNVRITGLRKGMENAQNLAIVIKNEERNLGQNDSEYADQLDTLDSFLEPLEAMWSTLAKYQGSSLLWYHTPIQFVNSKAARQEADVMVRQFNKIMLTEAVGQAPPSLIAGKGAVKEIEIFLEEHFTLLSMVATPGLTEEHWRLISKEIGLKVEFSTKMTLDKLIKMYQLHQKTSLMEAICLRAHQEWDVHLALDSMEGEWDDFNCDMLQHPLLPHKMIHPHCDEDTELLLDEQALRTKSLSVVEAAIPHMERVKSWMKTLKKADETMRLWLYVQDKYFHLAAIFIHDEVRVQLPEEGDILDAVKLIWDKVMDMAAEGSIFDQLINDDFSQLLEDSRASIEIVQESLMQYLTSKRKGFPRFYFLSDEEIMKMLSDSKDSDSIQKHFSKVFDGLVGLQFGATDADGDASRFIDQSDIIAMKGAGNESIGFKKRQFRLRKGVTKQMAADYTGEAMSYINPDVQVLSIDIWLAQVEEEMGNVLKETTDFAIRAYSRMSKKAWLSRWPLQAVLAVKHIFWTMNVERCINDGFLENAYNTLSDQHEEDLKETVRLLRLEKNIRQWNSLNSVITMQTYQRDVIKLVRTENVSNITDFSWTSHIRHYYTRPMKMNGIQQPSTLEVALLGVSNKYGYEYLKASSRLVLTPLTLRCFRSLSVAARMKYFGALHGPGGVGKTETIKDYTRLLGRMCLVLNCSDAVTPALTGRIIKGVAASAVAICFDDFNRMSMSVVSVVAQQLGVIRQATIEAVKEEFLFEGEKIRINETSYVFLTMNTMVFEKHTVPVSFKTLFRDITLTHPNYGTICEAVLTASGFYYSHEMAKLITSTYDHCAEVFCTDSTHDWSLRPMKAVFRTAADEIRHSVRVSDLKVQKHEEKNMIYHSLIRIHEPQFDHFEEVIFRNIVDRVFAGESGEKFNFQNYDVYKTLQGLCTTPAFHLNPTKAFVKRAVALYETLYARKGVLLLGETLVGKTTCLRLLTAAFPLLRNLKPALPTHFKDFVDASIETYAVSSKAYSMENLFGRFHEFDNSWVEGFVEKVLAASGTGGQSKWRSWLIFDGPVDTVWIEYLNSALDDTSRLSLANGKSVEVPQNFRFIFETSSIASCTPASISRCGTVFMTPTDVGWQSLVDSWLKKISSEEENMTKTENKRKLVKSKTGLPTEKKKSKRLVRRESIMTTRSSLNSFSKKKKLHNLKGSHCRHFTALFEWLIPPINLLFEMELQNHVIETSSPALRVHRMTTLIDTLLHNTYSKNSDFCHTFGSERIFCQTYLRNIDIECIFVFALAWSFGNDLNSTGQTILSDFVMNIGNDSDYIYTHKIFKMLTSKLKWQNLGIELELPLPKTSIFQLYYNPDLKKWKSWADAVPLKANIDVDASFQNILIPTPIGIAFEFHAQSYINQNVPLLLYGSTGSGKSAHATNFLHEKLNKILFTHFTLHFSANTTVEQTQHELTDNLEKPRKGCLSSAEGTRCVVFIDDMHMVKHSLSGEQPPNELIRSVFDYGGWYNDRFEFQTLENVNFVSAVTTGLKTREDFSHFLRLSSHYASFRWSNPDKPMFHKIFSAIMGWYTSRMDFIKDGRKSIWDVCNGPLVHATIHIYTEVSKYILPSPSKPLNVFNPRDMGSVIQGILLIKSSDIKGPQTMMRLWTHEVLRVFFDRLSSEADMDWMFAMIKKCTIDFFNFDFDKLFSHLDKDHSNDVDPEELRMLYFGGFVGEKGGNYKEVENTDEVIPSLEKHLKKYNGANSSPMDLVVFSYAAEHISRILRILRMPGRHGLLVGMVGSGRQSLTKLAAHIAGKACRQINERHLYQLQDWKEDLKGLMKYAGIGTKGVVFVVNHTQMLYSDMIGDLDSFLHTGTISGLFSDDELHGLHQAVIPFAREAGYSLDDCDDDKIMIEYFLSCVRESVTIILCFSPLGNLLRETLHEYSGIASCCTIDWYEEWPLDALSAMAHKLFDGINLDLHASEAEKLKQDRESSRMHFAKLRRRKRVGNVFQSMNAMVRKISALKVSSTGKISGSPPGSPKKISKERMNVLKRKLKAKVRTISLVSMSYFKSKAEQRSIIIDALVEIAINVHIYCRTKAEKSRKESQNSFRRITYVTPRNYLDLLASYKKILDDEQLRLGSKKRHYESGVSKIDYASSEVGKMRGEIHEITPILVHATEQTAELMEKLEERMPAVREARDKVKAEEEVIRNEQNRIQKFKSQVEKELKKCRPQLAAAIKALDTLTTKDISLVKTMKNPPKVIKSVMHSVCLLLDLKPFKTKTTENWWKPSVKLLNNKNFIEILKEFDKENIKLSVITNIRKNFLSDPDFNPARVKKASSAAEGICKWVLAIDKYDSVLRSIRPKVKAIAEAEKKLKETLELLHKNQAHLKQIEGDILALESRYEKALREKTQLNDRLETCKRRVHHAEILLEELGGERELWFSIVQQVSAASETVIGDMLLLATNVSYSGSATPKDRHALTAFVQEACENRRIPVTKNFTIRKSIGIETEISKWQIAGLPDDTHHVENGIILNKATLWPLLIDPHGIATRWIKNLHTGSLSSAELTQHDFLPLFENAIEVGLPFLIERVPERLPNDLDPILFKQAHKSSGSTHKRVKISDREIEWNDNFRLYIATDLHDPHFLPTVSTKVIIMDFSVTPKGMDEAILSLILSHEKPELEHDRITNMKEVVGNQEQLKQCEERILKVMAESMGNILDDEKAIAMLRESQKISKIVAAKQKEANEIELQLEEVRGNYLPAAQHGRVLYFVLSDMDWVNCMYRFSIKWFNKVFLSAVRAAKRAREVVDRVRFINREVNSYIFRRVSPAFASYDRLSFAMCMCIRTLEHSGSGDFLSNAELGFLLTHHDLSEMSEREGLENPGLPWLHAEHWTLLVMLSEQSEVFNELPQIISENVEKWHNFYHCSSIVETPVPGYKGVSEWHKMILLKCIRPDSIINISHAIIRDTIGSEFLKRERLKLNRCYGYSDATTPMIFVLHESAYDPTETLRKYANKKDKNLIVLSVQKGREEVTEKTIRDAAKCGDWVLVENCHLLQSWMHRFEELFEEILTLAKNEALHSGFRLWCTSEPCAYFPVQVLQEGIKMMVESPTEFRETVLEAFDTMPLQDQDYWERPVAEGEEAQPKGETTVWKRTAFALVCLHANMVLRGDYSGIGWNCPYSFGIEDLRLSLLSMNLFTKSADIDFRSLRYCIGECLYGGKFNDASDAKLLTYLVHNYLDEKYLLDGDRQSRSVSLSLDEEKQREWALPPDNCMGMKDVREHVRSYPKGGHSDVIGLDSNAVFIKQKHQTHNVLHSLMLFETQGGHDDTLHTLPSESELRDTIQRAVDFLPKAVSLELHVKANERWAITPEKPHNAILQHELKFFERAVKRIMFSLLNSLDVIDGKVNPVKDDVILANAVREGHVPPFWITPPYQASSFMWTFLRDLKSRCEFFTEWALSGAPRLVWLGAFAFPGAYLNSLLQEMAYATGHCSDDFELYYIPVREPPAQNDEHIYLSGLMMESARWLWSEDGDDESGELVEGDPIEVYLECPVLRVSPRLKYREESDNNVGDGYTKYVFDCPMYKTFERVGRMSTHGDSDNFIGFVPLPTSSSPTVWALRGAAILLQTETDDV